MSCVYGRPSGLSSGTNVQKRTCFGRTDGGRLPVPTRCKKPLILRVPRRSTTRTLVFHLSHTSPSATIPTVFGQVGPLLCRGVDVTRVDVFGSSTRSPTPNSRSGDGVRGRRYDPFVRCTRERRSDRRIGGTLTGSEIGVGGLVVRGFRGEQRRETTRRSRVLP